MSYIFKEDYFEVRLIKTLLQSGVWELPLDQGRA